MSCYIGKLLQLCIRTLQIFSNLFRFSQANAKLLRRELVISLHDLADHSHDGLSLPVTLGPVVSSMDTSDYFDHSLEKPSKEVQFIFQNTSLFSFFTWARTYDL